MALHPPIRDRKPSEDGFILLAVLILLALFLIAMAAAAPRIAADIQRDRDVETMHRGKQYVRAIQLYYRKFHAYPPNLDALVKTNNIRFLRKKYIDPTTGKADWKPIMMCQNKTPMAMGFFGQPLGAASGCGVVGGAAAGRRDGPAREPAPGRSLDPPGRPEAPSITPRPAEAASSRTPRPAARHNRRRHRNHAHRNQRHWHRRPVRLWQLRWHRR